LRWLARGLGPIALAALWLGGCASSTPPPGAEGAAGVSDEMQTEDYRIGVDDSLQVIVWKSAELSVNVPVRPDGMISVPLIGDVRAGGRTAHEVAAAIRDKLSQYIRDPNVTVIVTGLRSHEFLSRVRVTGAVRTPRSFPYRRGMTVLDVVLESGGVNDFASPNNAKLYRRSASGKTDVYDVELGNILNKGRLETNYSLKPGDVITVPERIF
jgi:polysaccharide export outer membrane protein